MDGEYSPNTRLHLGPIGSGRDFIRSDQLRTEFAKKYNLLATDLEMSSVLESIIGNCRDSFILIKGKFQIIFVFFFIFNLIIIFEFN